eukprot:jgi/Chrzof1/100/Cz01g03150.t1
MTGPVPFSGKRPVCDTGDSGSWSISATTCWSPPTPVSCVVQSPDGSEHATQSAKRLRSSSREAPGCLRAPALQTEVSQFPVIDYYTDATLQPGTTQQTDSCSMQSWSGDQFSLNRSDTATDTAMDVAMDAPEGADSTAARSLQRTTSAPELKQLAYAATAWQTSQNADSRALRSHQDHWLT